MTYSALVSKRWGSRFSAFRMTSGWCRTLNCRGASSGPLTTCTPGMASERIVQQAEACMAAQTWLLHQIMHRRCRGGLSHKRARMSLYVIRRSSKGQRLCLTFEDGTAAGVGGMILQMPAEEEHRVRR